MNCTAVQGKTQPCRIEVLSKAVSQSPSASLKGVFSDPVEKGVEQEAHDAGHTDDGRQSNCQRQDSQRDPPLAAAQVVGDEAAGRSPRSAEGVAQQARSGGHESRQDQSQSDQPREGEQA